MIPFPDAPRPDAMLEAARPSAKMLAFLGNRRSFPAAALTVPGPDGDALMAILHLAIRVPDHRRLAPWRFIIFEGEARIRAGAMFAKRYATLHPEATDDELARERRRFCCAPAVVAVISSPDVAHKTPVWEQELSAGAVCYNLLLASNAAGWAGSWLTGWMAFDGEIAGAFGLGKDERVAGFLHLGTAREKVRERPRPELTTLVSYWNR